MAENTHIDTFYGLNMNETGSTNLKLGESGNMVNFRITSDLKLEKMYGYTVKYIGSGIIRAIWIGKLNGIDMFIYVCGGKIYRGDNEIGSVTDGATSIFEFNKKLYFITGSDYKEYDGVNVRDVVGYIPLIKVSCAPSGEGTELEPINLLSGSKRMSYLGDGTTKEFYIGETNVSSIDSVKVDGIETSVTKDLVSGKVTFSTAPASASSDNVEIQWTKGSGDRAEVYRNHYVCLYGIADDTRVFMYGNAEAKNRIIFSDLNGYGVADVSYFPSTNFIDIGSSNEAVTDIQRQYDRIIVSKESSTYYGEYQVIEDTTGETIISFPMYPLNKAHGAIAYNQGQVLDSYVTEIDSSIVQWVGTYNKDERNAKIISEKIEQWLNKKDLSKVVTLDYQEEKEYWIAVDHEVMIYNYGNGCYYLLNLPDKVKYLYTNEGKIYMGNDSGNIYEFSKELLKYNDTSINAEWQSGYYDFGAEEYRKTMRILWLVLKPFSRTSVEIGWISDRGSSSESKQVSMRNIDFGAIDFREYTFNTQKSVKPFRVKLKSKKFAFLKIILKNNSNEHLIVNNIAIKKSFGGEVK